MQHAWIIDVISDLQNYAKDNDLEATVEQMAFLKEVAAAEINALIEAEETQAA